MLTITPNERIAIKVRHEDADLVVVEKPAGLVTQPGKGHEHDTLLNGLSARYGQRLQQLGHERDFGLVHRLDRAASGLLVVALSARAYDGLRSQFETRKVAKLYWAIVRRAPAKPVGVIRRPIVEQTRARKTARVGGGGKEAITAYRVLGASATGALLECRPVTGRLHQIRVHLASIRCPILGDREHAPPAVRAAAPRLMLHAHRLVLTHPLSGERIDARSPLPRDMRTVLKRLGIAWAEGSADRAQKLGSDAIGEEKTRIGEAPAP